MINRIFFVLLIFCAFVYFQGCLSAIDYTNGAYSYYKKKKYDEAIDLGKKAVAADPNYKLAWFWLGQAYFEKQQYIQAIESFEKRISLGAEGTNDTVYEYTFVLLGEAYYMDGQIEKAQTAAEKALQLCPNSSGAQRLVKQIKWDKIDALIDQMYQALNRGDTRWALETLKTIKPKIHPYLWADHAGNLLMRMCDYKSAIRMYRESIELCPQEQKVKYQSSLKNSLCLAYCFNKDALECRRICDGLGFLGASIKSKDNEIILEKVEENTPAEKAGLESGDHILQIEGMVFNDAEQFIRMIKKTDPDSNLMFTLRRGDREIERSVTIGSSLEQSGGLAVVDACLAQELNREGVTLARQGKSQDALAKFLEALKKAPGPLAKAHFNVALIYQELGDTHQAMRHYIRAQRDSVLPDGEMEALVKLVSLTREAGIAVPESADRRYRIGIIRTKQKRYKEAIEEFEVALTEAPWMVEAYYNLGLVYDFNKQYQQSLEVLRIYAKLAPKASNIGPVKSKIIELEDRLGLLESPDK